MLSQQTSEETRPAAMGKKARKEAAKSLHSATGCLMKAAQVRVFEHTVDKVFQLDEDRR